MPEAAAKGHLRTGVGAEAHSEHRFPAPFLQRKDVVNQCLLFGAGAQLMEEEREIEMPGALY